MNRIIKLLLPALAVLLGFASCNKDDDGYSVGDFYLTVATMHTTADYFYLEADNGDMLYPSVLGTNIRDLADGARCIVNYTILGDAEDVEQYDYYIRVNGIEEMLTKPYYTFDENTPIEEIDSIGVDDVSVLDVWQAHQYLTVTFQYGGGSKVHYINLVFDEGNPKSESGAYRLELKHNRNGDGLNYVHNGMASFDMSEFAENHDGVLEFEIFSSEPGDGDTSWGSIVYEREAKGDTPVDYTISSKLLLSLEDRLSEIK